MAASELVLRKTAAFARARLAGRDASHDFAHAQRVQKLARSIALGENALAEQRQQQQQWGRGRLQQQQQSQAAYLALEQGVLPPSPAHKRPRHDAPSASAAAAVCGVVLVDVLVVELAALLHDVWDWKYAEKGAEGGAEEDEGEHARAFLLGLAAAEGAAAEGLSAGARVLTEARVQRVAAVVAAVGFKDTLPGGRGAAALAGGESVVRELACVADADMLDAMGAVGVCRAVSYGAATGRPLYDYDYDDTGDTGEGEGGGGRGAAAAAAAGDAAGGAVGAAGVPLGLSGGRPGLSKAEYMAPGARGATTLGHFHEKLLLLRHRMRTEAGRALAERRHEVMVQFLAQIEDEVRGHQ